MWFCPGKIPKYGSKRYNGLEKPEIETRTQKKQLMTNSGFYDKMFMIFLINFCEKFKHTEKITLENSTLNDKFRACI